MVIVGLILFGILGIGQFTSISFPSFSSVTIGATRGLCTLSASNIRIDSNIEELDSKKGWVVTAASGSCSEAIIGGGAKIDNKDVKSGEKTPEKDFSILTSNKKSWYEFNMREKTIHLFKPVTKEFECGLFGCGDAIDKCTEWTSSGDRGGAHRAMLYSKIPNSNTLLCSSVVPKGKSKRIGDFGRSKFKMDIKSCVDSGTKCTGSATLSSDKTSAVLDLYGEEKAWVSYVGDLAGNIGFPGVTRYNVIVQDGTQKLGSAEAWENYKEWVTTDKLKRCMENYPDNPRLCVDRFEDDYIRASSGETNDFERNTGFDLAFEEGKLRIYESESTEVLTRPAFTFKMTVDWVGMSAQATNPKITYAEGGSMQAGGQRGSITADVKNDGDYAGYIEVQAKCPSPLSDDSTRKYYEGGEQKRSTLDITAGYTSETKDYTCDVIARDTTDPRRKDTRTVEMHVTEEGGECTPQYEKKCYNGDVYWYDSCGQRGELFKQCTGNQVCRNGGCVSPGGGGLSWTVIAVIGLIVALTLAGIYLWRRGR